MIREKIKNSVIESIEQGHCSYNGLSVVFDFGDGEFFDKNGESYFYHIEFHRDTNEWIYEQWYEDEVVETDLSKEEKEFIQNAMIPLK